MCKNTGFRYQIGVIQLWSMESPDWIVNSQWGLVLFFGHSHHIQNSHSKAFFLCFMSNRHLYPSIQKIISPLTKKNARKQIITVALLLINESFLGCGGFFVWFVFWGELFVWFFLCFFFFEDCILLSEPLCLQKDASVHNGYQLPSCLETLFSKYFHFKSQKGPYGEDIAVHYISPKWKSQWRTSTC